MAIRLIEGEKILKKTCPHLFSMVYLYLTWLYIGCVGVLGIVHHPDIVSWLGSVLRTDRFNPIAYFVVWSFALLVPAVVISFLRINWYWLFLGLILCAVGWASYYWRYEIFSFTANQIAGNPWFEKAGQHVLRYWPFSAPPENLVEIGHIANYWLILVSVFGLFDSNSYRRSHRYYITDRRVITRFGFLIIRERDLLYSKVDDLIIHQGVIGRILGFGTLIPISASGIGTGSDEAILSAGAEQKLPMGPSLKVTIGGGRSITVPRAPSFYSLYGVSDPEGLKNLMLKEMEKREYGYTRRRNEANAEKENR